jgi:hypothetical protein
LCIYDINVVTEQIAINIEHFGFLEKKSAKKYNLKVEEATSKIEGLYDKLQKQKSSAPEPGSHGVRRFKVSSSGLEAEGEHNNQAAPGLSSNISYVLLLLKVLDQFTRDDRKYYLLMVLSSK